MCGGARDDFQEPQVLELAEGAYQVAPASGVGASDGGKALVIEECELMERLLPVSAMDFLLGKRDEFLKVPLVTVLQERVPQHRAEGWGEREREAGVQAIPVPALQELQQRHVGFRDGLEEPVLFQELLMLWVPDKRQVRVED